VRNPFPLRNGDSSRDNRRGVRAVRAIFRQVKDEYPDNWLPSGGPTDESIISTFFPGVVVAEGAWCSLDCDIDDDVILIPPVLIGNKCIFRSTAIIGPYSAIGNTKVDEGAWVALSCLSINW
jgi:NDP-sugar pyrophosphorylase family protein